MVIAAFQVFDKLNCSYFFQKINLLAKISIKVVFGMIFYTFSSVDVKFAKKKLTWKIYSTTKALPIIQRVKFIDKKKFAKVALDDNIKAFVVHVNSLRLRSKMIIMSFLKSQQMYFQSKSKQLSKQSR